MAERAYLVTFRPKLPKWDQNLQTTSTAFADFFINCPWYKCSLGLRSVPFERENSGEN